MLRQSPAPFSAQPTLPLLMAAVVGSIVALVTGDVLYAAGIAGLVVAGAAVGWAWRRRRPSARR